MHRRPFEHVRNIGAVLAASLALAGVALWNGYPLVYYDSEDYVRMSFTFDLVIFRTLPYALFMTVARPFATLWAVVGLQALIAAWMLRETVAVFAERRQRTLLVVLAAGLALLSGLAWNTGQIMADAFTGLTVLGAAVLAFGDARLSRVRRGVLIGLTALSIVVHLSHVALSAGLLLVLIGMWGAARWWPVPRPRLAAPAAAIVLGILGLPLVHGIAIGQPVLSVGGQVLQLALFSQDGTAKLYLDKHCPEGAKLKLCPYKDRLPVTTEDFLWGKTDFPFWTDLGGWAGMRDEAAIVVSGTIREFPGAVLKASLINIGKQWRLLNTGEGLDPKVAEGRPGEFIDTLKLFYPGDYPAFKAARQQQPPGFDFAAVNAVHGPVAHGAILLTLAVLVWAWKRQPALAGLGVLVLLALLGNAIICGAGSNPHDRYQNRVAWLPLVVVGLGMAGAVGRIREPGGG